MSCIVSAEGFFVSGSYVVKELTIMFERYNYQHFLFDRPTDLVTNYHDYATIKYTEQMNGLKLANDGYLPYDVIGYILDKIKALKIYTAGNQVTSAIKSYLPDAHIIDICQQYGFKYPNQLLPMNCFVDHPARYCSLSKARAIHSNLVNQSLMGKFFPNVFNGLFEDDKSEDHKEPETI